MITPTTLLLTAVVVILLCGTKRLRNMGEDVGAAIKSFRKGLQGDEISQPSDQKTEIHNDATQQDKPQ